MRKIRIMEHISLDGVIQLEDGEDFANGGWTNPFRNPAGLELILEICGSAYDLVLGRRTYDIWAGYWPKAESGPLSNRLNAATKYVATHRPESLEWGPVKGLGPDLIRDVRALKATDGPDLILWGSSTLTSILLEQGLVDEIVLITYPVLLGRGKRMFSLDASPRELAFVSTKTTPTGVLLNTYRYVGALKETKL